MSRLAQGLGLLLTFAVLGLAYAADEKAAPKDAKKSDAPKDEKKNDKKEEKKKVEPKAEEPKEKFGKPVEITGKLSVQEGRKELSISVRQKNVQVVNGVAKVSDWLDIKVIPTDDMKVRLLNPPVEFDDKGKPKRYTAKELKELKGEGAEARLIGYKADFDTLKSGQTVRVTVAKKIDPSKPAPKKRPKKGEEVEPEDYYATLILILGAQ